MQKSAVQSWCFRGFETNQEVAEHTRAIGLAAVELCAKHIDFNNRAGHDAALRTYRDAGVDIVSAGVNTLSDSEPAMRPLFEFVKAAGAGHMSVSFSPESLDESLRLAGKLADEYDIRLGIHNHGGRDWLGNSRMLAHVLSRCSERIGLCLDTAWAMDAGEDPIDMVRRFGARLHAVHIKDFEFDRAGTPRDVVVGSGNLDLGALREALEETGYDGCMIIEYEGDVDNPVPALRACVEAVEKSTSVPA